MTKEEIEKLMKTAGQVRGVTFKTDAEYMKNHYGDESISKVKKLLSDWGYPIDYEKIDAMEWMPIGLRILSLVAIKETFNLNDDGIKQIGLEAPKYSIIVKFFMKFFISVKKVFESAPKYWERHWSIGKIVTTELDEARKTAKIELRDFPLHLLYCKFAEGYYQTILNYVVKNAMCKETKCQFKGDNCHEFTFTW